MYADGRSGLDIFGLLHARSTDTLATLAELQTQLNAMGGTWRTGADGCPSSARVFAAPNLHKVPGGMTGYATELGGDIRVQYLQPTEALFEGITFARCTDPGAMRTALAGTRAELQRKLAAFNEAERARAWGTRTLSDLLPCAQMDTDFWWHAQEAARADARAGHMHMMQDAQLGEHNYYAMYQCKLDGSEQREHDLALRDSAAWEPRLTGYVALVQQLGATEPSFYLACRSSLPELAGPLVMALKNDLCVDASASEYADSKECWFLRQINHRNRCRLLARAAEALGLQIDAVRDRLAPVDGGDWSVAQPDFEVLLEDLYTCDVRAPELNDAGPLGAARQAQRSERVVRHVRGCVDAHACFGPLVLEIGGAQGFAVFTREPAATLRLHQCEGPALREHASRELMLFPAVNVRAACAADVHAVEAETGMLPALRIHDILYGVQQLHTRLPARVCALLEACDRHGEPVVFGKQYPNGLPTVLLPCHPLAYIPTHGDAGDALDDELATPRIKGVAVETHAYGGSQSEIALQDLAVTLDGAPSRGTARQDASKVQSDELRLELDDHALALLCTLALPHYAGMHAVRLVPCLGAMNPCCRESIS